MQQTVRSHESVYDRFESACDCSKSGEWMRVFMIALGSRKWIWSFSVTELVVTVWVMESGHDRLGHGSGYDRLDREIGCDRLSHGKWTWVFRIYYAALIGHLAAFFLITFPPCNNPSSIWASVCVHPMHPYFCKMNYPFTMPFVNHNNFVVAHHRHPEVVPWTIHPGVLENLHSMLWTSLIEDHA